MGHFTLVDAMYRDLLNSSLCGLIRRKARRSHAQERIGAGQVVLVDDLEAALTRSTRRSVSALVV
jgi:hypothetical protein